MKFPKFKHLLFAAVAAMGVAAFGEGESPQDIKIPMTVVNPVVPSAAGDPIKLVDGVLTENFTFLNYTGDYASIRSVVFDFGGQKTLTRMRVLPPSWQGRFAFTFSVSATGADGEWEPFASTTDSMSAADIREWCEFPVPEGLVGKKFRYAKIEYDGNKITSGCTELEFYSTDRSLTFATPSMWVKDGTALPTDGIQGKFLGFGTTGANIYCYAAKEDYGEDYAAWKENGQEFLVAENVVATGEGTSYSGPLPELDVGRHYLCVVAEDGENVTLSSTHDFLVGAPDAKIPLRVLSPDAPSDRSNPNRLVDGDRATRFEFTDFNSPYECVLDFGGQMCFSRMRAYSGFKNRFAMSFYVSATGEDGDWILVTQTTDQMATAASQCFEFPVSIELENRKVRYVKVKSDNTTNPGCYELEFYSADKSLTFEAPNAWMKGTALPADGIRGKFLGFGTTGANIYCYAAKEDYGEDYAAWKENGQEFLVAENVVATGEGTSYSGPLPELDVGRYYLCAAAVEGVNVALSPARSFVVNAPDVKIPMTVLNPIVLSAESDPRLMVDGNASSRFSFVAYADDYASVRSFVFDFCGQKSLTRMRVCTGFASRFAFSYYVSSTGADDDWTLWAKTTDMMATEAYQWHELPIPDALLGRKFSYAKIESNAGNLPGCAELEFYASDSSLTFDVPSTWESFAAMQSDTCLGIQGKLFGLDASGASISCCVAQEDLGDDYAAWKAKGREFLLTNDVVATIEGTPYSGTLPDLKRGYYYLRVFAVTAERVVLSPMRCVATHAVPAETVSAYVTSPARAGDDLSGTWVNGVIDGSQYESSEAEVWTAFDLKAYADAGLYVSGVRLFSRSNARRRLNAKVEWAYDDPENPASWEVAKNLYTSDDGKRKLDHVPLAKMPMLEWQSVADADAYLVDSRLSTADSVIELTVHPDAQASLVKTSHREKKLPRYLRVGKVESNSLVEIELRLSRIPPPKGLIIMIQ